MDISSLLFVPIWWQELSSWGCFPHFCHLMIALLSSLFLICIAVDSELGNRVQVQVVFSDLAFLIRHSSTTQHNDTSHQNSRFWTTFYLSIRQSVKIKVNCECLTSFLVTIESGWGWGWWWHATDSFQITFSGKSLRITTSTQNTVNLLVISSISVLLPGCQSLHSKTGFLRTVACCGYNRRGDTLVCMWPAVFPRT